MVVPGVETVPLGSLAARRRECAILEREKPATSSAWQRTQA
jgi:hypothetical protein